MSHSSRNRERKKSWSRSRDWKRILIQKQRQEEVKKEEGIENEGSEHVPNQDPHTGIGIEPRAEQGGKVKIEKN